MDTNNGIGRYEIVEGWFWFLADHHGGQGSDEYRRLSKVSGYFKPGPNDHGPRSEGARAVYNHCREEAGHPAGYVSCHVCWSDMIGHPGDICDECLVAGAADAYGLSIEAAAEYRPHECDNNE